MPGLVHGLVTPNISGRRKLGARSGVHLGGAYRWPRAGRWPISVARIGGHLHRRASGSHALTLRLTDDDEVARPLKPPPSPPPPPPPPRPSTSAASTMSVRPPG